MTLEAAFRDRRARSRPLRPSAPVVLALVLPLLWGLFVSSAAALDPPQLKLAQRYSFSPPESPVGIDLPLSSASIAAAASSGAAAAAAAAEARPATADGFGFRIKRKPRSYFPALGAFVLGAILASLLLRTSTRKELAEQKKESHGATASARDKLRVKKGQQEEVVEMELRELLKLGDLTRIEEVPDDETLEELKQEGHQLYFIAKSGDFAPYILSAKKNEDLGDLIQGIY